MRTEHSRVQPLKLRHCRVRFFTPLCMEHLEDRSLLAVQVVGPIVEMGDLAYFVGNDGINGAELWKSDGTVAGTTMVRDIRSGASESLISGLTNFKGKLFFSANDGASNDELWTSDGTEAGTVLFKDIIVGAGGSNPANFTIVGETLYFVAHQTATGRELWKSDGTPAGTAMVKDILPGTVQSSPDHMTNVSGTLFFAAFVFSGYELWKSNGTEAGTVEVKIIRPGGYATSSTPSSLTNVGGTLFFRANDGTNGYELWKSDGTDAGTVMVKNINAAAADSNPRYLTNLNGTLLFSAIEAATGRELWKSDGSPEGTVLVKDAMVGSAYPSYLANVSGTLFFSNNDDPANGRELWKSDGTTAGTVLVKDIYPGPGNGSTGHSYPKSLTNVNGTLFFTATNGASGIELWRSDGTAAGTVLVTDLNVGINSSSPSFLTNVNGTLFFRGNDGVNANALFRLSGPTPPVIAGTGALVAGGTLPAGTTSLQISFRDLVNGAQAAIDLLSAGGDGLIGTLDDSVVPLTVSMNGLNATLSFAELTPGVYRLIAHDSIRDLVGRALDGDGNGIAGGEYIRDFRISVAVTGPIVEMGNLAYFAGNDGIHGTELWKSDGTIAGTVMVKNIRVDAGVGSEPSLLTNVNGTLFFNANAGDANGYELWKSDGTAAGTVLVKDLRAGASSQPRQLTNVSGSLLFSANDGVAGYELWKSDGSDAGTTLVKDFFPGTSGQGPQNLVNMSGTLYFTATDATNDTELWKSNGTTAGTVRVKDIRQGPNNDSTAKNLTNVNGTLFFSANDGINGQELWKSDGTTAGTQLVKNIQSGSTASGPVYLTNVGGTLFFTANAAVTARELWKSDGTFDGTVLVKDIHAGYFDALTYDLANVNGTLLFNAADGTRGTELWRSDGTTNGTNLVQDIRLGSSSSAPHFLTNVNGTLFFAATDDTHGAELWMSNGTGAGTVLAADLHVGANSSSPSSLANVNGTLFFRAADIGTSISSLYWINRPAPPTVVSTGPSLANGSLPTGTQSLQFSFSELIKGSSADFELRSAGGDGLLGTADDSIVPVNASFSGLLATLSFPALPAGVYRLTARESLTDLVGRALDGEGNGIAGGNCVRDFVVVGTVATLHSPGPLNFPFDIGVFGPPSGQLLQGTDNAFDGLNRLQVGGNDYAPAQNVPGAIFSEAFSTTTAALTGDWADVPGLTTTVTVGGNTPVRLSSQLHLVTTSSATWTGQVRFVIDGVPQSPANSFGTPFVFQDAMPGTTSAAGSHSHPYSGSISSSLSHNHALSDFNPFLQTSSAGEHSHSFILPLGGMTRHVEANAEDWAMLSNGSHTFKVQVTGPTSVGFTDQQSLQAVNFAPDTYPVEFQELNSTTTAALTGDWADVPGLSASVSVADKATAHLSSQLNIVSSAIANWTGQVRFVVDGIPQSPASVFGNPFESVENWAGGTSSNGSTETHSAFGDTSRYEGTGHFHSFSVNISAHPVHTHNVNVSIAATARHIGVSAEDWVTLTSGSHSITVQVLGTPTASYSNQQSLRIATFDFAVAPTVAMREVNSTTNSALVGDWTDVAGLATVLTLGADAPVRLSSQLNLSSTSVANWTGQVRFVVDGVAQNPVGSIGSPFQFVSSLSGSMNSAGVHSHTLGGTTGLGTFYTGSFVKIPHIHSHSYSATSSSAGSHSHSFTLPIPTTARNVSVHAEDWITLSPGTHIIKVQVNGPPAVSFARQQFLQVAQFGVAAVLADGDQTVVSPAVRLAGLDVSREVTVVDSGSHDFVRAVEALTNPTATPITTTVRIVGNLGSDAATTVFKTFDGDGVVEFTDEWIGTDDADGSGTPAIVHYVHGPFGLRPTAVNLMGDNIEWSFNLTVPAGQTRRIASFTIVAATRAAAETAARALVTNSAFGGQAAAFLTSPEIDSLANFEFNHPPTTVGLSSATVAENTVAAFIGTITVGDVDAGDSHTLTVDDPRFEIVSGQFLRLKAGQSLDFEAAPALPLSITATDAGGLAKQVAVTVNVTNVNEAPTAVALSNSTVAENAAAAVIGDILVTDADAGDFHTLTVDDPRFEIAAGQLRLKPDQSFNFETTPAAPLIITATDAGGLPKTVAVTIDVTNVNEPPTAVALANSTVVENAAAATIGSVTVADPDVNDSHAFVVTDPRFEVAAGQLRLKSGQSLNFEATPSVPLTITATDAGGLPKSQTFTISVTNVNEPPRGFNKTVQFPEDQDYVFQIVDFALADLSDVPANSLSAVKITTLPTAGSLLLGSTTIVAGQFIPRDELSNLRFLPEPDANGVPHATLTFQVQDDGGTASGGVDLDPTPRSVTVNVTAVNDGPGFTMGTSQTARDDQGNTTDPILSFPGWAINLSKGPSNESGQTLSFVLTAEPPGLFSVQPAIDSAGTLTFKPAPNVQGRAVVSVQIRDNGGTLNGGVDISVPKTFHIDISKPLVRHNTIRALDVTGQGGITDGVVVAGDALSIINRINAFGSGPVTAATGFGPDYWDTTGDGNIAPNDVVLVINWVNAFGSGLPGPEGESGPEGDSIACNRFYDLTGFEPVPETTIASNASAQHAIDDLIALLASDTAEEQAKRRSRPRP